MIYPKLMFVSQTMIAKMPTKLWDIYKALEI